MMKLRKVNIKITLGKDIINVNTPVSDIKDIDVLVKGSERLDYIMKLLKENYKKIK